MSVNSVQNVKTIFVFIPNTLDISRTGILEGFTESNGDNYSFYITNDKLCRSSKKLIGYCSSTTPDSSLMKTSEMWIHINNKTGKLVADGFNNDTKDKIKIICYDYKIFINSDLSVFTLQNYNEHFHSLIKAVQEKQNRRKEDLKVKINLFVMNLMVLFVDFFLLVYDRIKLAGYSATAVHMKNSAITFKWVYVRLKTDKKITLSVGNTIVSKIVDFATGLLLLYFVMQYETQFVQFVQSVTENIIHRLEQLLYFLMGSPVGLKLNYAFNKTLGTFFLYHISLWRAFLQSTSPLLKLGLHYLLIVPGAFGLSFQAALFSDLVAFCTFHVYCIYVYAARLYAVQIKSLISLWRLFIGRKYNPLRERVDSHQYTHNQLFIGTLGFTVLLFLLPTTFLYYAVFIVFRLGLIVLDGILIRLRYILQCLPLYVGSLWIVNSPRVRGSIRLRIKDEECSNKCATIHATLQTLSLFRCITSSIPHTVTKSVPPTSWSLIFKSVVTGVLL